MKIYEIAPGEKMSVSDSKIVSFVEIVSIECSAAWNMCGKANTLLFRGVGGATELSMFHGKSRETRRALSTPQHEQLIIDNALQQMGFKALRSNSIFCTSNEADAASYGKPFIVFPKNGFNFTWSPEIGDLFIDLRRGGFNRNKLKAMSPEQIVSELGFTNENFMDALKSDNEIIISGEYYACDARYINYINAKIP